MKQKWKIFRLCFAAGMIGVMALLGALGRHRSK